MLLLVCLLLYQCGCGRLARCGGHAAEAKGRFAAAGSAGSWGGLNNRAAGRRVAQQTSGQAGAKAARCSSDAARADAGVGRSHTCLINTRKVLCTRPPSEIN